MTIYILEVSVVEYYLFLCDDRYLGGECCEVLRLSLEKLILVNSFGYNVYLFCKVE